MSADENQVRHSFAELLSELTDSDLVIEATGSSAGGRTPQLAQVDKLRSAVEASYKALAGSAQVDFSTVAVLEEIAKHSLSLWLRVDVPEKAASGIGDGSLLKFLARGTLAIVAWMDGSPTLQLADLQQAIRVLAWGTSITTHAHPVLPSSVQLVDAIAAWQDAKAAFGDGDSVRIFTNNGSAELDLSKRIEDPRTLLLARKLVNHSADMIFVVEMPDYQGSREWRLKHGDTTTIAYCDPGTLLDKFYKRELDIRPGDALRCKVDLETSYGPDHEVLTERYRIVEIVEVLSASKAGGEPEAVRPERSTERSAFPELESTNS